MQYSKQAILSVVLAAIAVAGWYAYTNPRAGLARRGRRQLPPQRGEERAAEQIAFPG